MRTIAGRFRTGSSLAFGEGEPNHKKPKERKAEAHAESGLETSNSELRTLT